MVTDTLDMVGEDQDIEEEEAEGEIDKILSEVTGGKLGAVGNAPETAPQEEEEPAAQEESEADEAMFDSMRERLKTLQT